MARPSRGAGLGTRNHAPALTRRLEKGRVFSDDASSNIRAIGYDVTSSEFDLRRAELSMTQILSLTAV
jgi:hypothetical protein